MDINLAEKLNYEDNSTTANVFDTVQDRINKAMSTEIIKELRNFWKEDNESSYKEKGIGYLCFMLLGICDKKVYIGEEILVYIEILELRDYLNEKYFELSEVEALKFKKDVERSLNEANEVLATIYNSLS